METRKTKLALTASALAFALMLAGCGGGGGSSSAVTPSGGGGTPQQQEPEEQTGPVAVMMDLMLPTGLMPDDVDLPDSGDTVTIPVRKGETVIRGANEDGEGGVEFMCESDYDCSLTLTNQGGTLVAEYSTKKKDADADNPMVTAMVIEIPEPTPEPMEITERIPLNAAQRARLNEAGGSGKFTIPAGGSTVRAGVTFTCNSEEDCEVTVSRAFGVVTAEMKTIQNHGDEAPTVTAVIGPNDPLRELNEGNAMAVARILQLPIDDGGTVPPGSAYDGGPDKFHIGGMGWDQFGVANLGADNFADVTLTSSFDPNGAAYRQPMPGNAGADPTTLRGSMLRTMDAGEDNPTNKLTENADTVAMAGWEHHVLFADWGDTHGVNDGGFETGALIYSDIEAPMMNVPFADVEDMLAHLHTRAWFNLVNGMVTIGDGNLNSNWRTALGEIAIDVEGSQTAVISQPVNAGTRYAGSYFGARGELVCVSNCTIGRSMTADTNFGVADTDADAAGLQSNAVWEFIPADDAMVNVPDQDWIMFGAWMTTPDDMAGDHRLGVLAQGMQPYENGGTALVAGAAGVHGTATYSGGAAGTYVDEDETGFFTARATLTANFDVNRDNNPDPGDYTVSGRIDDFRNMNGDFLGADTAADPNDPNAGGENDWVVRLRGLDAGNAVARAPIDAAGAGPHIPAASTSVAGTADGVRWQEGEWSAQFYGPGGRNAPRRVAPTGIAGQFRATTHTAVPANLADYRAVVGSFGANAE